MMNDAPTMQHEITRRGPLLNADGGLAAVGWSPQPKLDSNLEDARFYRLRALQFLRMKRWDYYGIFTPTHYFSFTISNIGYMGMMFCYVLDLRTNDLHEESVITPFGSGVSLARNSTKGDSVFENGKLNLRFEVKGEKRRLVCEWPGFGESGLFADVMLSLPRAHESMNIVIPIEGNRFYFNRKINNMPVEGAARYGNETFALHPNCCLASLDWGRGVWAYQSHWVWASSSGMLGDGRRIGLNLGYGFGDNSKATENAVIIDGVVHKLGEVKFEFDSNDYNAPWTMRSDDGRLDLTLTPFKERVAKTDLKVLRSEVHQMFGRYDGTFRADDGEEIEIRQLVGFAEEHFAKW